MFIYTESVLDKLVSNSLDEYLFEANTTETFYIRDKIYPSIEKVLKEPEGQRKFSRLVEAYMNKNSTKLSTPGPQYLIPFTHDDQKGYFDLFAITPDQVKSVVKEMVSEIKGDSSWTLITQNPIYLVFYCCIRYFTIHRDEKLLNNALLITALAFYPSIFYKYYRFEPNPGVMQYTIDSLTNRFIVKKSNTIFKMLAYFIQNSWSFLEKSIYNGSDKDCIRFIQRIRNDQNSAMKKIKDNYMKNYKAGLTVTVTKDQYDDAIVVDQETDSTKVENITNKIVTKMISNGVNLQLCDFAANAANISKIELRNYLSRIILEKYHKEMKSFIESILFIYLYDEKHTINEINSKQFIGFALALFKKTNSKNENIHNIKNTLDKWGEDSGMYGKFNRIATRVDYSKGMYLYFIMSIQQLNN